MERTCIYCGESKPPTAFYVSTVNADGLTGGCRECVKAKVKRRYYEKHELVAAYERRRFKDPRRKAATIRYQRARRARDPIKNKARNAVSNAVRDGRIVKLPCQHCGNQKSQAHHHDYTKPLDVEWLCFKCHREHAHGQRTSQEAA